MGGSTPTTSTAPTSTTGSKTAGSTVPTTSTVMPTWGTGGVTQYNSTPSLYSQPQATTSVMPSLSNLQTLQAALGGASTPTTSLGPVSSFQQLAQAAMQQRAPSPIAPQGGVEATLSPAQREMMMVAQQGGAAQQLPSQLPSQAMVGMRPDMPAQAFGGMRPELPPQARANRPQLPEQAQGQGIPPWLRGQRGLLD